MPAIQLERSAVRRNKPTKIVWCLYCIRLGCTSCAMYTPCIEWGSQVTNISSNPHQTLLLKYAHFPPPPSSMSMSMCIHVMLHCVHKPKRARSFNFNHFDFLWQFLRAHRWDVSFLLRFESNLWEIEWKSPEIEASMSMSTMKNIQKNWMLWHLDGTIPATLPSCHALSCNESVNKTIDVQNCMCRESNIPWICLEETKRKMSELNLPIIVVCSEGAKSSKEIINSKCTVVTSSVCHPGGWHKRSVSRLIYSRKCG